MLRTFRLQTLTGNAQPLFGDVTTAAIVAPGPDQDVLVQVADTTLYQLGDRIVVAPGQAVSNILLVDSKVVGSTTKMMCRSEGGVKVNPYATATTIALAMPAMEIVVEVIGNVVIWLGTDNTVTSAGAGNAFFQVTSNLPYRMTYSGVNNTVRTTDAWMAATAGTQALVSAVIL